MCLFVAKKRKTLKKRVATLDLCQIGAATLLSLEKQCFPLYIIYI